MTLEAKLVAIYHQLLVSNKHYKTYIIKTKKMLQSEVLQLAGQWILNPFPCTGHCCVFPKLSWLIDAYIINHFNSWIVTGELKSDLNLVSSPGFSKRL